MIAKSLKMTWNEIFSPLSFWFPYSFLEIQSSLYAIFWKFHPPPLSEMGDENALTMLWKLVNSLFTFSFWNNFTRYFNSRIFFVIFSFHTSRGQIYVSPDPNCIFIVTKFCHTMVVIYSPQLPLDTKLFFHRVLTKPLH